MNLIEIGSYSVDLFTESQYQKLIDNGLTIGEPYTKIPVALLFEENQTQVWLVSELYEDRPQLAYGLFKLYNTTPKIGFFDLDMITSSVNNGKLVRNDMSFYAEYPLVVFAELAKEIHRIGTNPDIFKSDLERLSKRIDI